MRELRQGLLVIALPFPYTEIPYSLFRMSSGGDCCDKGIRAVAWVLCNVYGLKPWITAAEGYLFFHVYLSGDQQGTPVEVHTLGFGCSS